MQLRPAREAYSRTMSRSRKPLYWVRCYDCRREFWFEMADNYPIHEVTYFKNCFRRLLASSRCPDHGEALALDII
jgi:hypothetical protein